MRILLALGALALAGCMNMSGLDGETRYACAAPDGVTCDSVSGTYVNALRHKLPSQRGAAPATGVVLADASAPAAPSGSGAARDGEAPPRPTVVGIPTAAGDTAAREGKALRTPARILRLWTKPWEDADGDLWDQGYVYVQIDTGRWQLDHVHQRIRDHYRPLQPPPTASPAATSPQPESGASAEAPTQSTPHHLGTNPFGNFPNPLRSPTLPGQRQP